MARYLEFLTSPFKSEEGSKQITETIKPKVTMDTGTDTSMHVHKQLEPTKPPYSMDNKKAITKKIRASERDATIETEYKVGNIVMKFQAGYYEIFKLAIHKMFENHQDTTISYEKRQTLDKNDLEVSYLYKVYKSKVKVFTINLYNTSCTVVINGTNELSFINDHLPVVQSIIEDLKHTYGSEMIDTLNTTIHNTLIKMNVSDSDTKVNISAKCPKCRQNVRTRAVQCQMCNLWVHYRCEKLHDNLIEVLEDPDNLYIYRCKMCTTMIKEKGEPTEKTHENSHLSEISTQSTKETAINAMISENIDSVLDISQQNNIQVITEQPLSDHEHSIVDISPARDTDKLKSIEIENPDTIQTSDNKNNKWNSELDTSSEISENEIESNTEQTNINDREIKITHTDFSPLITNKEWSEVTEKKDNESKHDQSKDEIESNTEQTNINDSEIKITHWDFSPVITNKEWSEVTEKKDNESKHDQSKGVSSEEVKDNSEQHKDIKQDTIQDKQSDEEIPNTSNDKNINTHEKHTQCNSNPTQQEKVGSPDSINEPCSNKIDPSDDRLVKIMQSLDSNMTLMTDCIIKNVAKNDVTPEQNLIDKVDECITQMRVLTKEIVESQKKTNNCNDTEEDMQKQILETLIKIEASVSSPRTDCECHNEMLKCLKSVDEKLSVASNDHENEQSDIIQRLNNMEARLNIIESQKTTPPRTVTTTNEPTHEYTNRNVNIEKPTSSTNTGKSNKVIIENTHENTNLNQNKQEIKKSDPVPKARPSVSYAQAT